MQEGGSSEDSDGQLSEQMRKSNVQKPIRSSAVVGLDPKSSENGFHFSTENDRVRSAFFA